MPTQEATSTPASTRVFLLPELLEGIISQLSKVDILTRAQLVSRTWNSAAASPLVQDKLWRRKSKKPAVLPIRTITDSGDDRPEDTGLPIYKMPIMLNGVFSQGRHLYQDFVMASYLIPRHWMLRSSPVINYSRRDIRVEYVNHQPWNHSGGELRILGDPTLSWRSMQICNPPIATARLNTVSGANSWDWADEQLNLIENSTTLFDKNGITMGLVHDTAAAILRTNTGEQDPRLGWRLLLSYGIQDSYEGDRICGHDGMDDDGGQVRETDKRLEDLHFPRSLPLLV
jgi:hypothetical protein